MVKSWADVVLDNEQFLGPVPIVTRLGITMIESTSACDAGAEARHLRGLGLPKDGFELQDRAMDRHYCVDLLNNNRDMVAFHEVRSAADQPIGNLRVMFFISRKCGSSMSGNISSAALAGVIAHSKSPRREWAIAARICRIDA
jgi:hypothetical protein